VKEVKLTNGKVAFVDDEDYERVIAAGNWYETELRAGGRTYAYKHFGPKYRRRKVYLHTFILGSDGDTGLDTDHEDGNGLNCQRFNMKMKTRSANNLNNHNIRSDNKSGRRGVYFDQRFQRWKAEIKIDGKKFGLGSFYSFNDACTARERAEENYKKGAPVK
jgi:hypothetical protein